MTDVCMKLNPAEHNLLQKLLETALEEVREDLHYTHFSPAYLEKRHYESKLIERLLEQIHVAIPE